MSAVYEKALEPEATPAVRHRLSYQPALDGVRGVSVALVIIFHLQTRLFPAGYIGVSVFFTLSGFLITSLLLDEWHATESIALRRFYLRRIKRLAPASLLTVFAVVMLAALGLVEQTSQLRGDVIAAGFNVFNWREVIGGDSYAALFEEQSPVAHFWSLAIEEQFYLVWPVAMLLALRFARAGRTMLMAVIGVAYLASLAASLMAGPTVAYFATWPRAAEIMAGALFAVWTATSTRESWPAWWRFLAAPSLLAILVLASVSGRSTGWAYDGGLGIFALVSVALIAGLQVDGPVKRLLSNRALVTLGALSYGLYLVHWPVFVVLDEERLGTGGAALVITRLAVTTLAGGVLYLLVERPFRAAQRPTLVSIGAAAALAGSGVIAVAAIVVIDTPETLSAAPAVVAAPDLPTPVTVPGPEPEPAGVASDDEPELGGESVPVVPPEPVRLAVFGDSIPAWLLRDAAANFDRRDFVILNGAAEACDGMVDLPTGRDRRLDELEPPPECQPWPETYPAVLDADSVRADVGLLVLGQAPVIDRLIDGEWKHPCDGIDWYLDDVAARIGLLREAGVRPLLALPARFGARATFIVPDDAPQRMDCVRMAMAERAGRLDVSTIDLDTVLCPGDACDTFRTNDGMHVNPEFADAVLAQVLDAVAAV